MPVAFQFASAAQGKPQEWFDLEPVSGVTPSGPQAGLKDRIVSARDRIDKELANSPKQAKAFQDLKQIAADMLVNVAQDPPSGSEDRVKAVLTAAGLDQPSTAGVPGGWTIAVASDRLDLTPPKDGVTPTGEQIQLAADLTRVARHLVSLYAPDRVGRPFSWIQPRPWGTTKQADYLARLKEIAAIGLGGEHPQVAAAKGALASLETEIFILRGFVKRRWYLMKCAAYSAMATIIALAFYNEHACQFLFDQLRPGACGRYRPIFLVLAGSMLGMWLSIASGRVATSLDTLEQVINDPVGAGLRVWYVLTVAFAGAVLLLSGMVEIKIGTFDTQKLGWVPGSENPMIGLMIGILFGFSEKTLPNVLATRAADFVQSLGSNSNARPG